MARWILRVALGAALVTSLAAPAPAQTTSNQAARPARRAVEIDVHGGFAGPSQPTKGTGALPAEGTSFTNYTFSSCGGSCPKNETDTVDVRFTGAGHALAVVLGGGIKGDRSARLGWRLDVRVFLSRNADATSVSASPIVAFAATGIQDAVALGKPLDLQFSTVPGVKSSLSDSSISDFRSFTGSGLRAQATLTGGIVFRF